MLQLYTTSRATCFQRCKREHQYGYEMCRRPRKKALALSFGSLYHNALEVWRKLIKAGARDAAAVLAETIDAMRADFLGVEEHTELNPFEYERAEKLFMGYHARWFDHDTSMLEYLFVEEEFTAPMINPETGKPSRTFQLAGKIDGGAKWCGHDWTVESKTTSADITPGSDYWLRLRMDSQVSTYMRGATALGMEPHGCIYDVSKKPGQKPSRETPDDKKKFTKGKACKACKAAGKAIGLKAAEVAPVSDCNDCEQPRLSKTCRARDETAAEFGQRIVEAIIAAPDAYYQRGEVIRLDTEMVEFDNDQWMTARALRDCQLANSWPRNPNSCIRYGRLCGYWDVCTGADNIDNDDRFRTSHQHAELSLGGQANEANDQSAVVGVTEAK